MKIILEADQLELGYRMGKGHIKAVGPVNFQMSEGECVGLIGESGAGKSTLALEILDILRWKGGVRLGGELSLRISPGKIAYIPQDPHAALDPLFSIGNQLRETGRDSKAVMDALEKVRLPLDKISLKSYPHELSGGMKQRVLIAMALLREPELIVADEPTSSLDVTLQAEMMALFREIHRSGIAFLFVTHQVPLAKNFCRRAVFMRAGQVVEEGAVPGVFINPKQDYTRMLMASVPRLCFE